MPQLPIYQQQTVASGELRGGNLSPPNMVTDSALGKLGEAMTGLAGVMKVNEENSAKSWFAQSASEIDLKAHEDFLNARNTAPAGAKGFAKSYLDRVTQLERDTIKNAPNETAKRLLQNHFAVLKEQYGRQALNYEIAEQNRFAKEGIINGVENRSKLIAAQDGGNVDAETERALVTTNSLIDSMELPPDEKSSLKDAARQSLLNAGNKRKIELDPAGYLKRSKAYAGGFDEAVEVILQEEGGYAEDDGGSGSPVNFGINQGANPDIDVKTLTKDKAKEIYKERYWKAIGGDSLPPEMQLLAMDAAVNQGVGWTQKALKEAAGDPAKFVELREKRYVQIAKNPTKAKYLGAWLDRLERVSGRSVGKAGLSTYDMGSYEQQQAWNRYAEQELRRQQAVLQATMGSRLQDEMAMALDNVPADQPITQQELVAAYGDVDGIAKYQALVEQRQLGQQINSFQTMTDAEILSVIQQSQPKAGEGYADDDRRYKVMQMAAQQVVTQRQSDPVAYAMKTGITPSQALDGQDMPTITAQIKQRGASARIISQKYGTPLAVFTKAEAKAIGEGLQKQGIDGKMSWIKMVREAIPDNELYQAALQQIRPDSPVTAIAGVFLSHDKSIEIGGGFFSGSEQISAAHVASMLLKGEALLNPVSSEKKQDGTHSNFPMPQDAGLMGLRAVFEDYVGEAFRGMPETYNDAYQAFRAYYAAETAQQGKPSANLDKNAAKKAVKAVIGSVVDINGNGEVIAPWGMSEAKFEDQIQGAWREYVAEAKLDKVEAEAFKDYGLFPTDITGVYAVTNGTTHLYDRTTGKPVILDIRAKYVWP